jgi:hypothetical protein
MPIQVKLYLYLYKRNRIDFTNRILQYIFNTTERNKQNTSIAILILMKIIDFHDLKL